MHTGINQIASRFNEAREASIIHADELSIENLCLFINGILRPYCLCHVPADKRYVMFKHPNGRLLDYLVYAVARRLTEQGITFVNLDSDMGV